MYQYHCEVFLDNHRCRVVSSVDKGSYMIKFISVIAKVSGIIIYSCHKWCVMTKVISTIEKDS